MIGGRIFGKEKIRTMKVGHSVDLTFWGPDSPYGEGYAWVLFEKVAPDCWKESRIWNTHAEKTTYPDNERRFTDADLENKVEYDSFYFSVPLYRADGGVNMLRTAGNADVFPDDTTYDLAAMLRKVDSGEATLKASHDLDGDLIINIIVRMPWTEDKPLGR